MSCLVDDPIVVNTVSKVTVSLENDNFSESSLLYNISFLHEAKETIIIIVKIVRYLRIIICNYVDYTRKKYNYCASFVE